MKSLWTKQLIVTIGLFAFVLEASGCGTPTRPSISPARCAISGDVRDTNGQIITIPHEVRVQVLGTPTVIFSDSLGHYNLVVWTYADSLTLIGSSGFGPYVYAYTCSGTARIGVAPEVRQDLRLTACGPI